MMTYKYRLYPKKSQISMIENHLEICRQVYNKTLETKINRYKQDKKNLSLYDLHILLTSWKKEDDSFNIPSAQVLQKTQEQVDFAFSRFFAKQNKYPRFKGKNRVRVLKHVQRTFKIKDKSIYFCKIGTIKCKFHRKFFGNVKSVSIFRNSVGKFFACITTDAKINDELPKNNKNIGIDLGVRSLAVLSDGNKIENPKFVKKFEKSIAKLDRRVSKNKTNKNYHSRALVYEKLSNSREDFAVKQSNKLVRNYDIICFEKLNKAKMLDSGIKDINKAIFDACWGRLVQYTIRKAESAGKIVALIEPQNTSRTCSRCGIINDFSIKELIYRCNCGLYINRDLNASINILRLGLESLAKA